MRSSRGVRESPRPTSGSWFPKEASLQSAPGSIHQNTPGPSYAPLTSRATGAVAEESSAPQDPSPCCGSTEESPAASSISLAPSSTRNGESPSVSWLPGEPPPWSSPAPRVSIRARKSTAAVQCHVGSGGTASCSAAALSAALLPFLEALPGAPACSEPGAGACRSCRRSRNMGRTVEVARASAWDPPARLTPPSPPVVFVSVAGDPLGFSASREASLPATRARRSARIVVRCRKVQESRREDGKRTDQVPPAGLSGIACSSPRVPSDSDDGGTATTPPSRASAGSVSRRSGFRPSSFGA